MNTENKIVIGIDVGISTTKIVGLRDGKVISPFRITATLSEISITSFSLWVIMMIEQPFSFIFLRTAKSFSVS